jgi:soluble lytic murein transglycosylase
LLDSNEASARAEAEAWLLGWVDPAGEMDDLSTLADALAQDPRYQRGIEYLSVGLDHEAVDEFEIMRRARQDEPLLMYGLALATRELGVYKTSIRCALRVAGLSPAHAIDGTPRFLQQLAYPIYFDDLVLAEAAANNLDPLLIFALIRQESLFEPGVRSYAQAIGLMQIIPSTGEWIALQMEWQDFVPAHLTRPYLNVHFGALAAYNSGIAAPSRWLDVAGDDSDLFVETIDYSQTLHYVQLIYQHHAFYRRIYQ